MQMQKCVLFAIAFICCSSSAATNELLHSIAEISTALLDKSSVGRNFDISATVIRNDLAFNNSALWVTDKSGTAALTCWPVEHLCNQVPGDVIRANGIIVRVSRTLVADVTFIKTIAHTKAPSPTPISASDLNTWDKPCQFVSLTGILTDVFRDEIDPRFVYLVLMDSTGSIYAPFQTTNTAFAKTMELAIGSKCTFNGFPDRHSTTEGRRHLGMELNCGSESFVRFLDEKPNDPYDVSPLHDLKHGPNPVIAGDLLLRKVRGKVLAVWQGSKALVRTDSGFVSEINFSRPPLPRLNETVEAVGMPETDLYQLNLSKAIWRKTPDCVVTDLPPETVSAPFMLTDGKGNREVKVQYSGRVIRLTGLVRALPAVGNGDYRLNLNCDGFDVPVDFSSVPAALAKIADGCVIEATGVCVLETENWRPQTPFPRAKGFSVIMRSPEDVRIVSRPPFWTPLRLTVVIGALLLALVGIGIWNRILRRIVDRRSRQLTHEQLSRRETELRIDERTHLAVELHDSISQNLTGVALEISAAGRAADSDRAAARRHLDLAEKTLKSCRNELKNCLWDLRNNMLDETDINEAIRRTLAPQIGDTHLTVRFDVRRKQFTENTIHAILRIIRELAVNAVRHGSATEIKVAGSIEDDRLLFSVRDNGRGFDPANRPGMAQGHFGLQGVKERVKEFAGELKIESAPEAGTKVTIALQLPHEKGKKL